MEEEDIDKSGKAILRTRPALRHSSVVIETEPPTTVHSYCLEESKEDHNLMFNQEESDRKKSDEAEVDSLEVTNTIEVVATASMVSGCKKVSTFAADAIQGQFPRPTSSLAKKQTRMQNLADIASDLNKENWTMKLDEGTGKDGVKMNK
ncbi:hypothetical protein LINPERHAP1_LOCUS8441, partial [Linum perenne]